MSSAANYEVMDHCGKLPVGMLVQQVFSLDSAIRWVALEEAGREPRCAWHDPDTGDLHAGTTTDNAFLADPLTLMLGEDPEAMTGDVRNADSHRLRFIVLDYVDRIQIVARLGGYAHISVATATGMDACVSGTKLIELLSRFTHKHVISNVN